MESIEILFYSVDIFFPKNSATAQKQDWVFFMFKFYCGKIEVS